ncbi:MAG TPA: flavodoxin [Syntrophales bacterium]|nr:flavodoxin [Syntrophales bacterium]HQN77107.1 flavodoxin [Syntrophales bacterium]HQQ26124.1 flavodoxin [Syntrophales bacterium]
MDLSRRDLMKVAVGGLLAGIAAPVLLFLSPGHAAMKGSGGKKVLIVYFSRTGNTREIAHQIHEMAGGDIVELRTVEPYPNAYNEVVEQAREELRSGFKPALKTKVERIGSCDVVFVGSPNWWGTIAGPVKTFLSEYDLSGKTVIPFITHAGSGLGGSVADIAALCPNSTIPDGLAVWGENAKNARNDVSAWLSGLGMKE